MHIYAYDHLGNVHVKQVSIEGLTGAKTLEYVYDLAGRITGIIYPDGNQARYTYDNAGRLSRVGDANGNTLAAYTHTAAGNIGTHVVGADIATGAYSYNPREWVTDIDYAGKFSSELTYDLAGNVTRQQYSHGNAASKTADYAYDNLYRITGFDLTGGTSRDYAYDRSGNLKSVVTGSSRLNYNYSGTSTPNRLDSTAVAGATTTYAYNRNGWMTRKGADTVRYDYRGLTTGYGSARYLMDPDRRRVKKTVGTAITYYLRGPGGNVLAEYTGQTQSSRYVYAGSRRIARIAGSSASYYLADHLGSTRSLVDEAGSVTVAYEHWPYGKILATSGTGATHFRFTGHERDAESGLDYMLNRNYDFNIGRFLRPDPMQDQYPGISPYAYAANNPLKYVDPDGREIRIGSTTDRILNFFGFKTDNLQKIEAGVRALKSTPTGNTLYQDLDSRPDLVVTIFDGSLPQYKLGATAALGPNEIDNIIDLKQIKLEQNRFLEVRGYNRQLTLVQVIALIIAHELGHSKAANDDFELYDQQSGTEAAEQIQALPYERAVAEEFTQDPDDGTE